MDSIETPQTIEVDRRCLLLPLINKLNSISENPREAIIELELLSEFPTHEVVLLELKFSPRKTIEHIIKTHAIIERQIRLRSDLLRIVIYKYWEPDSLRYRHFKFSNNMSLAKDIFIICYLQHLLIKSESFAVEAILSLHCMMKGKYDIKYDLMTYVDQNAITTFSIAYSFPSISFQWYGFQPDVDKSQNFSHFTFTTFPDLILEPFHWHPMIASIIPRLENSKFVPIALLTAINVKTNQIVKDHNGPNYTDRSLNVIYQRILELNLCNVFPVSLKLKLCKMWGIVYIERGSEYKYSDYFTTYRSVAMNIISELKSQDPDLQTILSEIDLEI
ncbi:unnamed protein product [Lasius platythorax]|uniref:Uncharacterized protein n=1 Tax=Lasius platythorax TaxID=488582 RepID=A0AAV2NPP6_9HYME